MRLVLLLLCVVVGLASAGFSPYPPGCFFDVQTDGNGVDWMVDPYGKPFVVAGVSNVNQNPDQQRYDFRWPYTENVVNGKFKGNLTAWADAVVAQLRGFNFNTAGAWSSDVINQRMPHIRNLQTGILNGYMWNDYFDPDWAYKVLLDVRSKITAEDISDTLLLGYFMGNELHWSPDFRLATPMIGSYLGLPQGSVGRQKALDYLTSRYGTVQNMKAQMDPAADPYLIQKVNTWDDLQHWQWPTVYVPYSTFVTRPSANGISMEAEWVYIMAKQYFSVVSQAIRAVDPNHLVFSVRMPGQGTDYIETAEKVWTAMRGNVDVAVLNMYTDNLLIDRSWGWAQMGDYYAWSQAPIMIGEFSFRARDTNQYGLNSYPDPTDEWTKAWTKDTQTERGFYYSKYIEGNVWWPHVLGYNWFEYVDQPAEGRTQDGEDSNFGIVNAVGDPYTPLTDMMTAVNKPYNLQLRHASSSSAGNFDAARIPSSMRQRCGPRKPGNSCPPNSCVHGVCSVFQNQPMCWCDFGWYGNKCDIAGGQKVLLRSSQGHLIKCDTANQKLVAVRVPGGTLLGDEFHWLATDVQKGARISLVCRANRQFVAVGDAGAQAGDARYVLTTIAATPETIGENQKFWVRAVVNGKDADGLYSQTKFPQSVALVSCFGSFLSVMDDGGVNAARFDVAFAQIAILADAANAPGADPSPSPSPTPTPTPSPAVSSTVLIRTHQGGLLMCDRSSQKAVGVLISNGAAMGDEFRWIVSDVDKGMRISVQCKSNGQFMTVSNAGSKTAPRNVLTMVATPAANIGDNQKFWVRPIVGGKDVDGLFQSSFPQKIAMASNVGSFLSCQNDGAMRADRTAVDSAEHFQLLPDSPKAPAWMPTVLLRTSNNNYISCADPQKITPLAVAPGTLLPDTVRWVANYSGSTSVNFKCLATNSFMSARDNPVGSVNVNSPAPSTWEQFEVHPVFNQAASSSAGALVIGGQVALKTFFGKYLSHDLNTNALSGDRDAPKGWEMFTVANDVKNAPSTLAVAPLMRRLVASHTNTEPVPVRQH